MRLGEPVGSEGLRKSRWEATMLTRHNKRNAMRGIRGRNHIGIRERSLEKTKDARFPNLPYDTHVAETPSVKGASLTLSSELVWEVKSLHEG